MFANLYIRLWNAADSAREREEGQTLVEYALIIALVSVALVGALTILADEIEAVFVTIGNALPGAPAAP